MAFQMRIGQFSAGVKKFDLDAQVKGRTIRFAGAKTVGYPEKSALPEDEHPHHQLGIDQRTNVDVERLQTRPQLRQIDEPVDLAQVVVVGEQALKAEAVNSASCITRRSPIMARTLDSLWKSELAAPRRGKPTFQSSAELSTIAEAVRGLA